MIRSSRSDYLLWLNSVYHDTPKRMHEMLDLCPDSTAFAAQFETFNHCLPATSRSYFDSRFHAFNADAATRTLHKQGIAFLTLDSPEYPYLLRQIAYPPLVLFYIGNPALLQYTALGVVGTRELSDYGKTVTTSFVRELAPHAVIVSGLARGVDTVAHETALAAQGQTIAVTGPGFNHIYPAENTGLFHRIAEHGLLLTEQPPDIPGKPNRFPQRNRIISGLSRAVLVTEAPLKSGALITARHAADQNRDVYCIPGPITDARSEGCHHFLREGATLVHSPAQILEDLGIRVLDDSQSEIGLPFHNDSTPPDPVDNINWSEAERTLYACLSDTPQGLDDLIQHTKLAPETVMTAMTMLQLQEYAEHISQNRYIRRRL